MIKAIAVLLIRFLLPGYHLAKNRRPRRYKIPKYPTPSHTPSPSPDNFPPTTLRRSADVESGKKIEQPGTN